MFIESVYCPQSKLQGSDQHLGHRACEFLAKGRSEGMVLLSVQQSCLCFIHFTHDVLCLCMCQNAFSLYLYLQSLKHLPTFTLGATSFKRLSRCPKAARDCLCYKLLFQLGTEVHLLVIALHCYYNIPYCWTR